MSYAPPKPPSLTYAIQLGYGTPLRYGTAELLEDLEYQLRLCEELYDWDRRLALWQEARR